jgi:hypothetical protein
MVSLQIHGMFLDQYGVTCHNRLTRMFKEEKEKEQKRIVRDIKGCKF